MEKKSERLEVRLGYQEKQAFTEACDTQGDTPSGAIRRFINGYVRRADADLLSSAWRGVAKRRGWKPAVFLAVFAAITGVFWALSNRVAVETDDAIFSARDVNGDGQLEYSEHAIPPGLNDTPNGVMRVLDLDASNTISRAEFVQKGRMAFAVVAENPNNQEGDNEQEVTLVEFEITKERAKTSVFSGTHVNGDGLDRLVIWNASGKPTVFEGGVEVKSELENIEIQADIITVQE